MDNCHVVALCNQKGGVGKSFSTASFGVGLARAGKKVLLVDADPQGSLGVSLGIGSPDGLEVTLATVMAGVIEDKPLPLGAGVIRHQEDVDILPANIELSGLEVSLFSVMSREYVLRNCLEPLRKQYDYILIDCMPSLGIMTVNALVAADSVIIPSQPSFLSAKGLDLLLHTVAKVRRSINPRLKIDGVLLTMVDSRTNNDREIVSGHRRRKACELAGLETVRAEIKDLTRDEAIVLMVDSNLQRSHILPSEKAYSYKMRLEAMKRMPGRPPKENVCPVGADLTGQRSDNILAEQSSDSARQIQRYIRLTELIPALLDVVDEGRIGMRPAVELSYLSKEAQTQLADVMSYMDATPSHDQAIRMRKMSDTGKLTSEAIEAIMGELKPNQREKISFRADRIRQYLPQNLPSSQTEEYVIKALAHYSRYQEQHRGQDGAR